MSQEENFRGGREAGIEIIAIIRMLLNSREAIWAVGILMKKTDIG